MFSKIKTNHKGFTLIELLISMALLTSLMFTGTYAYSLLANKWDEKLSKFTIKKNESKNLILLNRLLSGILPFVVTDPKNKPTFFFIGAKDSLLSISDSGIYQTKYASIFRLTAVKNAENKFDLIYQATSDKNILLLSTEQEIEFTKETVLFKSLDDITFSYYGYKSYDDLLKQGNDDNYYVAQKQWTSSYSGINNQLIPTLMKLELTKNNQTTTAYFYYDEDNSKWITHYRGIVDI
jgi:prepilin-type N-terminal cleavage/methylation domain-containing protein